MTAFRRSTSLVAIALAVGLIGAACASDQESAEPVTSTATTSTTTTTLAEDEPQAPEPAAPEPVFCTEPRSDEVSLEDTSVLYNPAVDSENIPEDGTYMAFDKRDGPESDYAPCFTSAEDSVFEDDTIVIGLAVGDTARAYARSQLIGRPVNDWIDNDPLLVAY